MTPRVFPLIGFRPLDEDAQNLGFAFRDRTLVSLQPQAFSGLRQLSRVALFQNPIQANGERIGLITDFRLATTASHRGQA